LSFSTRRPSLDAQLHAGDRRLQVVGNRRQQLHAFLEVGGDARLQGVEGHRGVAHSRGPLSSSSGPGRFGSRLSTAWARRVSGPMARRTASQVQSNSTASWISSTTGSQRATGTGAGVTSMVSGAPSARRRWAWKCALGPGISWKVRR
jgi:hypothetical protein